MSNDLNIHNLLKYVSEIEQLVVSRLSERDDNLSIKRSEELYGLGIKIIRAEVAGTFEQEIPLNVFLKVARISNNENILFFDPLRRALSRVCRVFSALVSYKTSCEKREIDESYRDELTMAMRKAMKCTPRVAPDTYFNFERSHDAVAVISSVASSFEVLPPILDVLEGPFTALSNMFSKVKDRSVSLSYCNNWFWIWMACSNVESDHKKLFEKFSKPDFRGETRALFGLEALKVALDNPLVSGDLKKSFITDKKEGANLCTFASAVNGVSKKEYSWKVRYFATQYLIDIACNHKWFEQRDSCIRFLSVRLAKEDDFLISKMIRKAFFESSESKAWIKQLGNIELDSKLIKESKKNEIASLKKEIANDINEKEKQAGIVNFEPGDFELEGNEGDYGRPGAEDSRKELEEELKLLKLELRRVEEWDANASSSCIDANFEFINKIMTKAVE